MASSGTAIIYMSLVIRYTEISLIRELYWGEEETSNALDTPSNWPAAVEESRRQDRN
jgi:hypothetical protein